MERWRHPLRLDQIVVTGQDVTITATSCQTTVYCPSCGHAAGREHSRYTRRPGDLPCAGRRMRLELNVRRIFGDNDACQQRPFVERLPGVVKCFARRLQVASPNLAASPVDSNVSSPLTAGLSLPWSNDQVEGQSNRLKLIKRTM